MIRCSKMRAGILLACTNESTGITGGTMKHIFQIKSKKDALFLAQEIKNSDKGFYYHVPLVGGMEGSFTTIRCDHRSNICLIYSSVPGVEIEEKNEESEIADHLWKERKLINAEIRDPDSEWHLWM